MTRSTVAKPRRSTTRKSTTPQIRTYRSALNFLDTLPNFEALAPDRYGEDKYSLSHIQRILSSLGNPQRAFRSVHIAGTKGKGSTATMLAAMLTACGHKVGLYTSPHLLNVRERIVIDGEMIPELEFTRAVRRVVQASAKARVAKMTYFEVMTAAAFSFFAQEQVDIAVVETGMGGRLDSTNVITPEVVGITSISFDHMEQLGTSLDKIADEKAGIIKEGIPIVCAPQKPEVRETIRMAAEGAGAPLRMVDEDVDFSCRFEFSRSVGRHTRICMTTPTSRFEHLHVPLLGDHQALNCGVALNMLDALKSRGIEIDDQAAMEGLGRVRLPGRMETVSEEPHVIVDGAHNAASIDALMRAIGQNIPYDSMVVVFGCQKHKDISGMLRRIQLGADKVIFTSACAPQSADPHDLLAEYAEMCGKAAQVGETLEDAMSIATRAVTRGDLICITGSFYLVGEAKRRVFRNEAPAASSW